VGSCFQRTDVFQWGCSTAMWQPCERHRWGSELGKSLPRLLLQALDVWVFCLGSEACCGWWLFGAQESPGSWCHSLPQLSTFGFCLQYKLCKVRKIFVATKGIPHLVTHDARTIRYPDPLIKVNDTVQIDLETGKITDFIKFDTGRFAFHVKHCTLP